MKIEGIEDHYMPDPGSCDSVDCGICSQPMTVTRNINGPTSFAAAMGRSHRLYDSFVCPFSKQGWHIQAKKLIRMAKETPSKRLEEMFLLEAQEILFKKTATKDFKRF